VKNGSGITGEITGAASGGTSGAFILTYPSTAVLNTFITSDTSFTGGQAYIVLENFFIYGTPTATVSKAVVNVENVLGQASLKNFYVANFANTVGVRVASSTGGAGNTGTGPLTIDNVWSDGFGNTGAKPCQIIATASKSILPIDWIGGVCNHPGSGLTMFEVNGGGFAGAVRGIKIHTYLENSANGASIGLKLVDVRNVDATGLVCAIQDTDTCVDISESGANLTTNIHLGNVYESSPTNGAKTVVNHITGDSLGGAGLPFYNFGGEATASVVPFTISGNEVDIKDSANNSIYTFFRSGNQLNRNFKDQSTLLTLDFGATAAQHAQLLLSDRGTVQWQVDKGADQSFNVFDQVDGKPRIFFPLIAAVAGSGSLRFGNTEHIGWRDSANGTDHLMGEYQFKRGVAGCTTAAAASAVCSTTITWPSAFADTN
jgi:hypothetical protein